MFERQISSTALALDLLWNMRVRSFIVICHHICGIKSKGFSYNDALAETKLSKLGERWEELSGDLFGNIVKNDNRKLAHLLPPGVNQVGVHRNQYFKIRPETDLTGTGKEIRPELPAGTGT